MEGSLYLLVASLRLKQYECNYWEDWLEIGWVEKIIFVWRVENYPCYLSTFYFLWTDIWDELSGILDDGVFPYNQEFWEQGILVFFFFNQILIGKWLWLYTDGFIFEGTFLVEIWTSLVFVDFNYDERQSLVEFIEGHSCGWNCFQPLLSLLWWYLCSLLSWSVNIIMNFDVI